MLKYPLLGLFIQLVEVLFADDQVLPIASDFDEVTVLEWIFVILSFIVIDLIAFGRLIVLFLFLFLFLILVLFLFLIFVSFVLGNLPDHFGDLPFV